MTTRPEPTSDVQRRGALDAAKLAALVTARWGPAERELHAVGTNAALIGRVGYAPPASGSAGRRDSGGVGSAGAGDGGKVGSASRAAWVLAGHAPEGALGPALVWAERQGVDELHLVADAAADLAAGLARQAALFVPPRPAVWRVDGTALARAEPSPALVPAEAPAPTELVDLLIDAGLEIVVEGGIVRGEVNGLEVARIVHGETSAGAPIDEPQLEVGVGKADRELTGIIHGELAPVDQLGRVVRIVREQRRPGAPRHPLNQLVPDRWLRAVLCRNPALVGLSELRPGQAVRPRANLRDRDVAIARGAAVDGAPVVVACCVGIALDLVPAGADAREAIDPTAQLLLAVPARDDHPATRRLAARLSAPAAVVVVPGDWRAAG